MSTGARASMAVVALGVIVAVAGCASRPVPARSSQPAAATAGAAVDLTDAIPWIDAPITPALASEPPPLSPRPTDARPCRAVDVATSFDGRGNGAGGHELFEAQFRNTSTSTCVLTGYPPLVTASEPGQPDVTGTDGSFFPTGKSANMSPGQHTFLGLETETYCAARPGGGGGGPLYYRIRIILPGGGTVAFDDVDGLDLACGLRVTMFYRPEPEPTDPPDPLQQLTASLEMPVGVAAGATLIYVVDLANPTDTPVTLAPCPAYLQSAASPATIKDIEALNCAPVTEIAGHGAVRFEMDMSIPDTTPSGPMTIYWSLARPGDVGDSAQVDITIAPSSGPS